MSCAIRWSYERRDDQIECVAYCPVHAGWDEVIGRATITVGADGRWMVDETVVSDACPRYNQGFAPDTGPSPPRWLIYDAAEAAWRRRWRRKS